MTRLAPEIDAKERARSGPAGNTAMRRGTSDIFSPAFLSRKASCVSKGEYPLDLVADHHSYRSAGPGPRVVMARRIKGLSPRGVVNVCVWSHSFRGVSFILRSKLRLRTL